VDYLIYELMVLTCDIYLAILDIRSLLGYW